MWSRTEISCTTVFICRVICPPTLTFLPPLWGIDCVFKYNDVNVIASSNVCTSSHTEAVADSVRQNEDQVLVWSAMGLAVQSTNQTAACWGPSYRTWPPPAHACMNYDSTHQHVINHTVMFTLSPRTGLLGLSVDNTEPFLQVLQWCCHLSCTKGQKLRSGSINNGKHVFCLLAAVTSTAGHESQSALSTQIHTEQWLCVCVCVW